MVQCQTLAGSNHNFVTYQLYDFGQIVVFAMFEFPFRRFLSHKAIARIE